MKNSSIFETPSYEKGSRFVQKLRFHLLLSPTLIEKLSDVKKFSICAIYQALNFRYKTNMEILYLFLGYAIIKVM